MPMQPPTLSFNRALFRPGERVAVAVSGGADSVALLLAIIAANREKHDALGIGISVVHVHHGIRGAEADADEAFVRALAKKFDLQFHPHHADVPARAAAEKETLEEAARNTRYGFFRELIASGNADAIATAHTLDDQAETVLMKILRGAWTEGMSGIHPVIEVAGERKGRIVRPFLNTRRAEIEAYLREQNQSWREDATNADTKHTRNRIRHEVMQQLRSFNPKIDEALANMAEIARDEEARWQSELTRLMPQLLLPGKPVRGGGRAVSTRPELASVAIELERLRPLDPALRRRVLRAAAETLGCHLNFDETARLLALCGFESGAVSITPRTGSSLHLSNGLKAERSARELRLHRG